jgi:hypothetical protein
MSMLYTKIKFKINTNNGELLETVWERIKEIKRGGGGILLKHGDWLFFSCPTTLPHRPPQNKEKHRG